MSVTDRAFIKAYAPREASASSVPACHMPLGAQRAGKPVAPELCSATSQLADGQTVSFAAPQPTAAPLGTYGVSLSAPTAPGMPAASQEVASRAAATQPLSTFAGVVEVESVLTPALEVEEFLWPETCTELLLKAESSFDQWAAKLAQAAMNGQNVILLSGLTRHEGRTTALLCLARRLAQAGVRTALVDADFHKPGLADALGVEVTTGWDEVLVTGAPLQEALIVSRQDDLTLLPLSEHLGHSQQLADNLQVAVGLRALADQYDLVLVDAGPALGSGATAKILMQQLDEVNVVLMRNVQTTPAETLAEAEQQLAAANVRLLGVAETFCPPPSEAKQSCAVQRPADSFNAA